MLLHGGKKKKRIAMIITFVIREILVSGLYHVITIFAVFRQELISSVRFSYSVSCRQWKSDED